MTDKLNFDIKYSKSDVKDVSIRNMSNNILKNYFDNLDEDTLLSGYGNFSKITQEPERSYDCVESDIKKEIQAYKDKFENRILSFDSYTISYALKEQKVKGSIESNPNLIYLVNETNTIYINTSSKYDTVFVEYDSHKFTINTKNNDVSFTYTSKSELIDDILKKNAKEIIVQLDLEKIKRLYTCLKLLKFIRLDNKATPKALDFIEKQLEKKELKNIKKLKSDIKEISEMALLYDFNLIREKTLSYNFINNNRFKNNKSKT